MKYLSSLLILIITILPLHAEYPYFTGYPEFIHTSGDPWWITYESNLTYYYQNIYHKYYGTLYWTRGNDHEFSVSSNTPHSSTKVEEWIKALNSLEVTVYPAKWSEYNYTQLTKKMKPITYNVEDLKHWVPRISFEDDPKTGHVTAYNAGKYYYTNSAYSIGMAKYMPKEWKPWTEPVDIDEKYLPYCGIVDDDLMYDFREEDPFKTVLTHNKRGPFLYVYDFKTYRDRIEDWVLHDRFIHGWKSHGKEEDANPVRLTYGPVLDNANHEIARALRVYAFVRLYLAKLRLAKLLHPAPEWDESIGDYSMKYPDRMPSKCVNQEDLINPEITGKEYLPVKDLIQRIIDAPNDDYWKILNSRICIPTESIDALKVKDWNMAKLWGSIAHHFEVFKDLYLYKMYVRSPLQKANDFVRYYTGDYLSIALWDGTNGYGTNRHEFRGGLKYFYPYFERPDKKGNIARMDVYKSGYSTSSIPYNISGVQPAYHTGGMEKSWIMNNAPSNTTGLIYAGYMNEDELIDYCKATKRNRYQVWQDALDGPFMIVSDRTYKQYGHAYFEKLAGHPLKKVDVTGALLASAARVNVTLDPDQLAQLINMDYFYYKNNSNDTRGSKTMASASSIKITASSLKYTGTYDPYRMARKPMTTEITSITGYDRSTAEFKNIDDFNSIIKDVNKGLAQDDKEFPGMSLRSVNYLPYHNEEVIFYPRKEQMLDVMLGQIGTRGKMKKYLTGDILSMIPEGKLKEKLELKYVGRTAVLYKGSDILGWSCYQFRNVAHLYPDVLRESLFTIPRTPRALEFLQEVKYMKRDNIVDNLKAQHGTGSQFIYQLQLELAERIPWMAFNPHMFLAYYKHIDALMPVHDLFVTNTATGKESTNGLSDGTMVWSSYAYSPGPTLASKYASCLYAKKSQTFQMIWAYNDTVKSLGSMVYGGRFRKSLAPANTFPWWEMKIGYVEGSMFMSWYYHSTYKWLQTHTGTPNLMRDPSWFIRQGSNVSINHVELFTKLFPGMFRYVDKQMVYSSVADYAHIPTDKSYVDFSFQVDARAMLDNDEYINVTQAYLTEQSGAFTKSTLKGTYQAQQEKLNVILSVCPRVYGTFVVSDGLQTSILKKKGGLAFDAYNSELYQGLETIASQ